MDTYFSHLILIDGIDLENCRNRVLHFFQQNLLVRYARVEINTDTSLPATDSDFWSTAEKALGVNGRTVDELLSEFQAEGYTSLYDLQKMEQGYQSKLLHTLAHLLDGFFGVDSYFYNMVEDSNRISDGLRGRIGKEPENYWLVSVQCWGTSESANQLTALRSTGKTNS